MLSAERWQQIEEIYHAARELTAEHRGGFLAAACATDGALLAEVESLLAQDVESGCFLETPVLDPPAIPDGTATADLCGRLFGAYRLISQIGSGGMGDVYLGEDVRLGRKVAVKVLPPEYSGSEGRRQRFAEEARAASALNHPNIVTVHDVGECEGAPFLVMEYVAGQTLARRIPRGGLPTAETLRYALSIAGAMAAVHAAGIQHRDLKPGNIMVAASGEIKILDFGLSGPGSRCAEAGKQTSATGILPMAGTAAYMAPERIEGQPGDERSDIFSFGAVLYEMATGERAFGGGPECSASCAVAADDPRFSDKRLPRPATQLAGIALRCLRKNRGGRFQSMAEVQAALETVAKEEEIRSRGEKPGVRLRSMVAAVTGAVLCITGLWFLLARRSAREQP